MAAAVDHVAGGGRGDWPPPYRDPRPDMQIGLVEVTPEALDTEMLGGAVAHHGCLVVRGLIGDHDLALARNAVDTAHENQRACRDGLDHDRLWYDPVRTGEKKDSIQRAMGADSGSVWLADSPRATAIIMDVLGAAAVPAILEEHFGEAPMFSLQKSTMRRIEAEERLTTWHQDGAFMGRDIRTMNLWVALTDCGGSFPASGLEIIPARMEEILDTTGGIVPYAVPFETIDEVTKELPAITPEFRAGDALFFDERFLHRTHTREGLTESRSAIECWFFAPSGFADDYVPLMV